MKSRQNLALMNILVSEWPVREPNVPQVSVKPRIGLILSISEPHVISWKAGLMGTEKRGDTKWPEEKAIKRVYNPFSATCFLPGLPYQFADKEARFSETCEWLESQALGPSSSKSRMLPILPVLVSGEYHSVPLLMLSCLPTEAH